MIGTHFDASLRLIFETIPEMSFLSCLSTSDSIVNRSCEANTFWKFFNVDEGRACACERYSLYTSKSDLWTLKRGSLASKIKWNWSAKTGKMGESLELVDRIKWDNPDCGEKRLESLSMRREATRQVPRTEFRLGTWIPFLDLKKRCVRL